MCPKIRATNYTSRRQTTIGYTLICLLNSKKWYPAFFKPCDVKHQKLLLGKARHCPARGRSLQSATVPEVALPQFFWKVMSNLFFLLEFYPPGN